MCSLLIMGISNQANAENKNKVTLAIDDWPPFISKDLYHNGIICHIIKEAYAQEGVEVKYIIRPWKRALVKAGPGKWNGSPLWGKSKERDNDYIYTCPIMRGKSVLFYRKGLKFDWENVSDLKGYMIGTTIGYIFGDEFEKAAKDGTITIDTAPTDLLNMMKLLKKRIDIFVCDLDVGYQLLNDNFSPDEVRQIEHNDKPLTVDDYFILFSKKDPANKQLVELFNKGYKKLEESGKIKQMWQDSREGKYKKPKPEPKKKSKK